jgi:hypothetical protein
MCRNASGNHLAFRERQCQLGASNASFARRLSFAVIAACALAIF